MPLLKCWKTTRRSIKKDLISAMIISMCVNRSLLRPKRKDYAIIRLRIKPLRDEVNIINNEKSFAINVIDKNRQILIATQGPHPDIRSIRNALMSQSGYQVTITYLSDKIPEIQAYDAVVLSQVSFSTTTDTYTIKKYCGA